MTRKREPAPHEPTAEFRALFRPGVEMPQLGKEAHDWFDARPDDMAIYQFVSQMFEAEARHSYGTGKPLNIQAVCASAALGLIELGFHRE